MREMLSAHFLPGLGIRSFSPRSFAQNFNEQLRVIRSDRPVQMSYCERIAQVAHDKRSTMSESLRSLMTKNDCERFTHVAHDKRANEGIAPFFQPIAHSLLHKNE